MLYETESFILNFCKAFKLPTNVSSTALQLYHAIKNKLDIDRFTIKYTVLFLGIKIEEIQEPTIPKLKKFYSQNLNMDLVLAKEIEIVQFLNYELVFKDVYMGMYGLLIELAEKECIKIDERDLTMAKRTLDLAMCLDYKNIKHAILASVFERFPLTDAKKKEIAEENNTVYEEVIELQKELTKVKILEKTELFKEMDQAVEMDKREIGLMS